jgi:hypothetical protein
MQSREGEPAADGGRSGVPPAAWTRSISVVEDTHQGEESYRLESWAGAGDRVGNAPLQCIFDVRFWLTSSATPVKRESQLTRTAREGCPGAEHVLERILEPTRGTRLQHEQPSARAKPGPTKTNFCAS